MRHLGRQEKTLRILFETKESEELGETTVLQARLHPSQQKLCDLLGTHCPLGMLSNAVFLSEKSGSVSYYMTS
jgi:hypothetical protein